MCVLPIRGRPLPRPVPVLDLTLLMFEWLLIFQLFSQPAMTQLIRKYDSSLGDWIPMPALYYRIVEFWPKQAADIFVVSLTLPQTIKEVPLDERQSQGWEEQKKLSQIGSWPRAWAETSAAPTGGESERQLLPDPVCFHSTSRAGRSCRQWKRHLDNSLGPS